MNDIKNDINLREAVSRREQKLPPMPADLNKLVMKSIKVQKTTSKQKRLWPWLGAVAASIILLIAFHFTQEPATQSPVSPSGRAQAEVAEVAGQSTPQPVVPQPAIEEKQEEPQKPSAPTPKAKRPQKPNKVNSPNKPQEEPLLAEADPMQEEVEAEPEYHPTVPNSLQSAEAFAQDIRSRGERLHQEIAQLIINQ